MLVTIKTNKNLNVAGTDQSEMKAGIIAVNGTCTIYTQQDASERYFIIAEYSLVYLIKSPVIPNTRSHTIIDFKII